MIAVALNGGLGNMMFQLASGMALAANRNVDFAVDLKMSHFPHKTIDYYRNNIFKKISENIKDSVIYPSIPTINERTFEQYTDLSSSLIYQTGEFFMNGYFQSAKYFAGREEMIYNTFDNEEVKHELRNKFGDKLKQSIALHVRRGDYLTTADFFPLMRIDYYAAAIKKIERTYKINNILVFSDDMPWCKTNLYDMKDRMFFVEGLKDYEQMYLMSLCSHNIIANSTFSWWGAWMNRNTLPIIVAPSNWFKKERIPEWSDIYTNKMHII